MNWALDFAPLLPPPALVVLCLAGAAVLAVSLWFGGAHTWLRALATLLLLLALFNPQLRREEREALGNIVLVVSDQSDSQKIAGRMDVAKALEKNLAERLAGLKGVEVRTVVSRSADDADGRGTSLVTDMNNALTDIPRDRLAGVFLITDGQVHDVPTNVAGLGLDAPVHTLLTGRKGEYDRRIELIEAPRFGLVGSDRPVRLKLVESGRAPQPASTTARLKLRHEGGNEEIRTIRIGEEVELDFAFPHAGQNILEIEADTLPGELTGVNNRLVVAAEGIRENLRVLLVSGEPHPGERTWRNLLRSDAAVDLVHFTILRPPDKQDGTPINELSLIAFPTRELFSEKLEEFDLVIFDRYRNRGGVLPLIYLDNVARYVENGGAVLIAAGTDFSDRLSLAETPLAQILPGEPTGNVIAEPYRARITKAGERHPVTRELPGVGKGDPTWGRWFRLIDTRVTSGDVLMQGPGDRPLLLLDRRAKGRVAMLMSDHAWLWARGYEGGGPYSTLLRRLAHWLMQEPDLEEEHLSAVSKGRKLTIERRSMQETVDAVDLVSPTGEKSRVELEPAGPGLWRKTLEADVFGLYRLTAGDLASAVYVGRINSKELSVVTATDALLAPLAKATGGTLFWPNVAAGDQIEASASIPSLILASKSPQMHGSGWIAIVDKKAYQVLEARLIPLFSGLIALTVLLLALSLTWLREGRS